MCRDYYFLFGRDLPHCSAQDPSAGARYSSSGVTFSGKTETVSMGNELEGENLQGEGYEEMEVPSETQKPNTSAKPQSQTHSCLQSSRQKRGQQSRQSNFPGEIVYESID